MNGQFEYAIVGVEDRLRNERLNAGIVVFDSDGLRVTLPRRLDKLRSLSGALDIDAIKADIEHLQQIDAEVRATGADSTRERIDQIRELTRFSFSAVGSFEAHNVESFESSVRRLLQLLVEPEVAPPKLVKKRTRLTSALRAALRSERVLARKGEGLAAHRVVPNVQIADGLSADFVLKNGAMHIIETVDASSEDITLRKVVSEIAVSALVLEQARMTFGETQTTSRIVYEASNSVERLAKPSLEAAVHQGAELINWASSDDRNTFLVQLASLADPVPTKREERFALIHASTQNRFDLN